MRISFLPVTIAILASSMLVMCKKNSTSAGAEAFSYGDSIFFHKDDDYYIKPTNNVSGSFSAWPEGLELDESTGRIRIGEGKSESGLRYKVYLTRPSGKKDSTTIVVAGVNYFDKYYHFSQNDSIAYPLYNADPQKTLPAGYFEADDDKVAINSSNGQINLKQTWRNGFANGLDPADPWKEVKIRYRLQDASQNADNEIRILLYYYNHESEITQEIRDIVKAHETMLLSSSRPIETGYIGQHKMMQGPSAFKPRPPCVIIVGN